MIDKSFVVLRFKTLPLLLNRSIGSNIIGILWFVVSILEARVEAFLITGDIDGQSEESLEVGDLEATLYAATISLDVESDGLVHEVVEVALVLPLVHVEDLVEIEPK